MKFEYIPHAEERIRKRKLDKSLIEETIRNPEKTAHSDYGKKIVQRTLKDKILRVVYEEKEGIYIIITAYYTKAERYR